MSFTDGKAQIATQEHCDLHWRYRGEGFRCYLCGHKFAVGDGWRFVYANSTANAMGNILVCAKCDGPDVLERYVAACEEARTRFWWLVRRAEGR